MVQVHKKAHTPPTLLWTNDTPDYSDNKVNHRRLTTDQYLSMKGIHNKKKTLVSLGFHTNSVLTKITNVYYILYSMWSNRRGDLFKSASALQVREGET